MGMANAAENRVGVRRARQVGPGHRRRQVGERQNAAQQKPDRRGYQQKVADHQTAKVARDP
jgi:hypothetical protein